MTILHTIEPARAVVATEVCERSELGRLRDEWRALVDSSPDATLFETWEWITTWLDHFWRDRPLAFLEVRRRGTLVGVAPLLDDRRGEIWHPGSMVLPVNAHAKWSDLVHGGDAASVLEAVLWHARRFHPQQTLALPRQRVDSAVTQAIREEPLPMGHGMRVHAVRGAPSVRNPGGRAAWEAGLHKKVRHELKRKARRIRRDHDVVMRVVTRPEDVDAALDQVLYVEDRSWKAVEDTSLTTEPGIEAFYRDLAHRLARAGWWRQYLLYVDGEPAAHLFGAVFNGRYFAMKTSYDGTLRRLSPGLLLMHEAIGRSLDDGLASFELLGEPSRWKAEMSDHVVEQADICLFGPANVRCRWCAARDMHLKPLAKRMVEGAMRVLPIAFST
ncbi:MAG: GNAT family N-acetyltransferase [Myxococcota bacterium]